MNGSSATLRRIIILLLFVLLLATSHCLATQEEVVTASDSLSSIYVNTLFLNMSMLDSLDYIKFENVTSGSPITLTNLYWADTSDHSKPARLTKNGGLIISNGTMEINHETGTTWYWKYTPSDWNDRGYTGICRIDISYTGGAVQALRVTPTSTACGGYYCGDSITIATDPYTGGVGGYSSGANLEVKQGTYYTSGGDYGGDLEAELSATGTFCLGNQLLFNLTVTPDNPWGLYSIAYYKDGSGTSTYSDFLFFDEGPLIVNRSLEPASWHIEGYYEADDSEIFSNELDFDIVTNCTAAWTGTINKTHNPLADPNFTWTPNYNNTPWAPPEPNFNNTFCYEMWIHGLINDTEKQQCFDYWNMSQNWTTNNTNSSPVVIVGNDITAILENLEDAGNVTRANLNTSHGILSTDITPVIPLINYALAFFPPQIVDLITVILVINVAMIILWGKKG